MRNCGICGKPVTLAPSAKERAEKYGGTPEFYTGLFPNHAQCEVAKRADDTLDLMRKLREEKQRA